GHGGGMNRQLGGERRYMPRLRVPRERRWDRVGHVLVAGRVVDQYAENTAVVNTWETVGHDSECYPPRWQDRVWMIAEVHNHGYAFDFALLDPE
ncbi:30S ribosomal protein S5 alanine N-acetyltransferase, partial [Klebsiella pneumoniae]